MCWVNGGGSGGVEEWWEVEVMDGCGVEKLNGVGYVMDVGGGGVLR